MSSAPPASPSAAYRRRRGLVILGLGVLVVVSAVLAWRTRGPLLPIPTPARLDTLDPQVRAHLAQLVRRVSESPRDPDLRADLGLAFAVNGLWFEARQSFRDALQLGSSSPLPALYAAVALHELGDDPAALRELRAITLRFPGFPPAWHRLGRALLAAGDPAEALPAFQAVTRLAPNAWHGWAGTGEALIRGGQPADAVAPLERARQLDPAVRSVRHLLAQAYRAAGRTAEAEVEGAAGKAQNLSPMPDDWSARALDHMRLLADQFERVDELLARNQAPEAVARLRETLRFHPTNNTVLQALARALVAADQPAAAWQLLDPALAQRPDDPLLLAAAAGTAAALERTNEALAFAARALATAPNSAESRVAQANALLAAGRDEEAADALRQALRLTPDNTDLHTQLGDLLRHNLGRLDEARTQYLEALRQDPIHLASLLRLIDLEIERGHPAEAAPHLAILRSLHFDPAALRDLEARLRPPPSP